MQWHNVCYSIWRAQYTLCQGSSCLLGSCWDIHVYFVIESFCLDMIAKLIFKRIRVPEYILVIIIISYCDILSPRKCPPPLRNNPVCLWCLIFLFFCPSLPCLSLYVCTVQYMRVSCIIVCLCQLVLLLFWIFWELQVHVVYLILAWCQLPLICFKIENESERERYAASVFVKSSWCSLQCTVH